MYIHTHTYMYIHTHTCTYMYIQTHVYMCIHIHTHTHAYTTQHPHITHIHTYTHTHILTHIHTHIYIHTEYKLVDPMFHTPDQFQTVPLITGENSIVNCTVTSTVGFTPKWEGLDVQDLETNCTMNYNECVEKDMKHNCTTDLIDCVCVQQNLNGMFSVLVEQETVFDSSELGGTGSQAVLMKSSVVLVICNATSALENDSYVCQISDFNTSVEFSVTSLPPNISTTPHSSDNNTLYFIIFIILFVVTVIVVLVVMVIICRYCLVKRKPINDDDMIPLPPLCSEDKKEFPRYCLNLMELLGMYM